MTGMNQQLDRIKKQIKALIEPDSLPEKENIITGVRF